MFHPPEMKKDYTRPLHHKADILGKKLGEKMTDHLSFQKNHTTLVPLSPFFKTHHSQNLKKGSDENS
jgi:hypothetical protein